MMNTIFFILALAMPVLSIAQDADLNKGMECDSKNQGEQEDCWAKAIFQKEYTTEYYKRYEGKVQPVYDNKYRYGNKFIEISNPTSMNEEILSRGIIYPELILGPDAKIEKKETKYLETLEKTMFPSNDTLRITNVTELTSLSKSPQIKRFKFWLYRNGLLNPTVYLFEIINKKANKRTSLSKFISGAKLTFFKMGWVVI